MKNSNKPLALIQMMMTAFIIFLTVPQLAKAQSVYKLVNGADASVIKVLGSSNVHDWVMKSSTMESQGNFKFEGDVLHSLTAFSFSVEAKSLKSEHESMDTRTYKSMKADKYPKVIYKLNSAVITQEQKNKYLVKTTGDLTIAGVTQTIIMDITAVVGADKSITCTGSEKLKLTDYKIDPPSFMLGAMKVKNDLTIQFNLLYK